MILAIDPGPTHSGVCCYSNRKVIYSGVMQNEEILFAMGDIRSVLERCRKVAIEWFESYGMRVGATVFDSVRWVGRFEQEALTLGRPPMFLTRAECALTLCHTKRAKDSDMRQRLIDLHGGDRRTAIGTKKQRGPLYGVRGPHAWSALAVAYTCAVKNNT